MQTKMVTVKISLVCFLSIFSIFWLIQSGHSLKTHFFQRTKDEDLVGVFPLVQPKYLHDELLSNYAYACFWGTALDVKRLFYHLCTSVKPRPCSSFQKSCAPMQFQRGKSRRILMEELLSLESPLPLGVAPSLLRLCSNGGSQLTNNVAYYF